MEGSELHRFEATSKTGEVSALWQKPAKARAVFVFAHGAGAPMDHPFMERSAELLAASSIATLRYNFPYMELGRRGPNPKHVLVATVRAALAYANSLAPKLSLFAGGKSMGGRMSSTAMAESHEEEVRGLIFYGFPLHAPGKPGDERAAHLYDVQVPMLFLQGTRDKLADLNLLGPVCDRIGPSAELHVVDDADHSFRVPKRAGRTHDEVLTELAERVSTFIDAHR